TLADAGAARGAEQRAAADLRGEGDAVRRDDRLGPGDVPEHGGGRGLHRGCGRGGRTHPSSPYDVTTRTGRRPGGGDSRGDILTAARASFADRGYDATSLRSVARAAGVDPALVHRFFGGKP